MNPGDELSSGTGRARFLVPGEGRGKGVSVGGDDLFGHNLPGGLTAGDCGNGVIFEGRQKNRGVLRNDF